jgi:pilus assembly protein CpaC
VSSLDFTNALQFEGFVVPALSTRRMESEMDLADGQSFAIAGLMDNRVTEQLEKIPWIGDVPVLGKLFQSKSFQRSKDELLVVVTPIIVKPAAPGQAPHGPTFPVPFLDSNQPKVPGAK